MCLYLCKGTVVNWDISPVTVSRHYVVIVTNTIKKPKKNNKIKLKIKLKIKIKKMWNKITSTEDNALRELLPEKRSRLLRPRGHEYEPP